MYQLQSSWCWIDVLIRIWGSVWCSGSLRFLVCFLVSCQAVSQFFWSCAFTCAAVGAYLLQAHLAALCRNALACAPGFLHADKFVALHQPGFYPQERVGRPKHQGCCYESPGVLFSSQKLKHCPLGQAGQVPPHKHWPGPPSWPFFLCGAHTCTI